MGLYFCEYDDDNNDSHTGNKPPKSNQSNTQKIKSTTHKQTNAQQQFIVQSGSFAVFFSSAKFLSN